MSQKSENNSISKTEIFNKIHINEIDYVVLGNYEDRSSTSEGNIDMFVSPEDYSRTLKILEILGFEKKSSLPSSALELLKQANDNPSKVFNYFRSSPKSAFTMTKRRLVNDDQGPYGIKHTRIHKDRIQFDIENHISYSSTETHERIRVDPRVEELMIRRRQKFGDFYIPSPPDELAHIISYCLYDKQTFSEYYRNRINKLYTIVESDEEMMTDFNEILSLTFFNADTVVIDCLSSGNIDDLWYRLKTFKGY